MKNKLSLDDLKRTELNILIQIDEICRKQGFRYSLIGGTLLGAVRHQGFIPWDDDIDIAMPRPDYEKFLDYCHDNCTGYLIVDNRYDAAYGQLFAKVCDVNTTIRENVGNRFKAKMGVYVDVFPLDGLGKTEKDAVKLFKKCEFKRELLIATNWPKFFRSKTHAWFYEPFRFCFFLLSRFKRPRKLIRSIEKRSLIYDFDQSNFAGCLCGDYRKKEIMPREVYSEYIELPFENHQFFALKDYDFYLSHIYGDYMTPPPENERATHHDFEAYVLK